MPTFFKKTKDESIEHREFFDEIKKAEKIVCRWIYNSKYDYPILEIFIINYSVSDKQNYFLIHGADLEVLRALEKKHCQWDIDPPRCRTDLFVNDKLESRSENDEIIDYSGDSDEAIMQRVMSNLPDIYY